MKDEQCEKSNPQSSPMVPSIPYELHNANHIVKYTSILCHDIQRLFRHCQKDQNHEDEDADAKIELISSARRWVRSLFQRGTRCDDGKDEAACNRRRSILNALAKLLRALDDTDVDNLQQKMSAQFASGKKWGKSATAGKKQPPSDTVSSSSQKRRRRLPKGSLTTNMLHAMHESGAVESEEDDWNSSGLLLLSNVDRHQRALRSHIDNQPRMGVSMKAILNAQIPTKASADESDFGEEVDESEKATISTLTHDAAVLRRDLYMYLAEVDTIEIKSITQQNKQDSEAVPMEVKTVTTAILQRITAHPTTPSMRLSAIIALDSLRELKLSDTGYRCILDGLLGVDTSWSLSFYAEIVAECSTYEKPVLLLRILSRLMQKILHAQKTHSDSHDIQHPMTPLLRALSHIMVRRHNTLAGFNLGVISNQLLLNEVKVYKGLCQRISMHFDSATSWIHPMMAENDKERVISVLQAEGILPLFCHEESDVEDHKCSPQSSLAAEEYPYPKNLSMRSAHERMGPCQGFNRLLSHPSAYEQRLTSLECPPVNGSISSMLEDTTVCSFAVDGDMLNSIFSFLGYRSLARASQCCKSWNTGANAPNLWAPLYFKKYKGRNPYFEEEGAAGIESAMNDAYFAKFLAVQNTADRQQLAISEAAYYNWKYLFKSKYTTEKKCKTKTCDVIGCSYVIRRKDHAKSHMKRHETSAMSNQKKRASFRVLQSKVAKLYQQIDSLEKGIDMKPSQSTLSTNSRREIGSPNEVLKYLVFPFLGCKDLLQPVCKLWSQMASSNELWEAQYKSYFGMPRSKCLMIPPKSSSNYDWKLLFRSAFLAKSNVRGKVNNFGMLIHVCQNIVGCNKELCTKLEYDSHLLKHDEKCCFDAIKCLKKLKRERKSKPRKLDVL